MYNYPIRRFFLRQRVVCMELIVTAAILVLLCYLLGVSMAFILQALLGLMLILLILISLFFVWAVLSLIGSKRTKVTFDRIDKAEDHPFPTAVYVSGDKKYRNTFPSELLLKNLLYKKDRTVNVRVTRRGKTYDLYSLLTVYIGLVLAPVSAAALGYWFIWAERLIF